MDFGQVEKVASNVPQFWPFVELTFEEMNSNMNVAHIKARFNEDIRRFQCPSSWTTLVDNLHELFSIPKTQQLAICYRDEENDLCTLSCQMELDFAISYGSPLQLVVRTTGPVQAPTPSVTPAIAPASDLPRA